MYFVPRLNRRQMQFYAKAGRAKIVFSDGMPCSGSTLIFNAARLVLSSDPGCKLSSGWVRQARHLPPANTYLIKTHGMNPIDAWRASRIIYSYRDPRDALVSHSRKFGSSPSIESCRHWMRDLAFAKKHADLMLRYESMIKDIPGTVAMIAGVLGRQIDVQTVLESLPTVPVGAGRQDAATLLYRNHRTGTVEGEWRRILAPELQSQITAEFGPWLEQNGYALS